MKTSKRRDAPMAAVPVLSLVAAQAAPTADRGQDGGRAEADTL